MTVVVGAVTFSEICLFADSRISWSDPAGSVLNARDVVQKLMEPNWWSLLAWAGNLCLGRDVVGSLFLRLKNAHPRDLKWLRDDNLLRDFIRQTISWHCQRRSGHKSCKSALVQFMIAWLDWGRNPFDPPMELIAIASPGLEIRRTTFGIDVIGRGEVIRDQMQYESYLGIACSYQDDPMGHIRRAFFCAGEAAKYLRQVNDETVGGLFQIAVLSKEGARLLDHFQLVPIADRGFGTYVAMRTRSGMWLQEHRPSGSLVKIQAPYDIELRGPKAQLPVIFDPRKQLTRESPGVIDIPAGPVMEFCLYDPENVPEPIRRSWGDEPLEGLSYAQGPPPKRWRRR